jgi:hypothetical protein
MAIGSSSKNVSGLAQACDFSSARANHVRSAFCPRGRRCGLVALVGQTFPARASAATRANVGDPYAKRGHPGRVPQRM